MKIDTKQIPNFDTLPEEAKNAILAMEFADMPDMSQFVAKATFDKKASEAADLGKKLRERMTEEETKAAQAAEEHAALLERVAQLEHEKAVGTYTTAYIAMGYEEKLARSSAEAMAKGDTETVLKNQKIHIENREKALRTELLKQTPHPAAGSASPTITKKEFDAMGYKERAALFNENPELYNTLNGGTE